MIFFLYPPPHDQMQSYITCHSLFLTRTQFKKFLGKSVKKAKHLAEEYGEKAVNKVKSVRDEGKGTRILTSVGVQNGYFKEHITG